MGREWGGPREGEQGGVQAGDSASLKRAGEGREGRAKRELGPLARNDSQPLALLQGGAENDIPASLCPPQPPPACVP